MRMPEMRSLFIKVWNPSTQKMLGESSGFSLSYGDECLPTLTSDNSMLAIATLCEEALVCASGNSGLYIKLTYTNFIS